MTNLETGEVLYWPHWEMTKINTLLARHREMVEDLRDPTSDLQNLPGTKPWFVDDWYGVVAEQIPPNPWVDPND